MSDVAPRPRFARALRSFGGWANRNPCKYLGILANPSESSRLTTTPTNPRESERILANPSESWRIPGNPSEAQRILTNQSES